MSTPVAEFPAYAKAKAINSAAMFLLACAFFSLACFWLSAGLSLIYAYGGLLGSAYWIGATGLIFPLFGLLATRHYLKSVVPTLAAAKGGAK